LLDFIEEKGKEVALTLSVLRKWERWKSLTALILKVKYNLI
jgi:hypothetical protein